MHWEWDNARHLVMRLGLGFVLGWFGVQELHSPSQWGVFVPSFVANISPVNVDDLILLHGFLLVVACAAVVLGFLYRPGCILAMALLGEIIFGLWWDGGGISDLVVRDIGLLGLAAGMALDQSRFLHADNVLPRLQPRRSESAPAWPAMAFAATALMCAVAVLGVALYETGSGTGLAGGSDLTLAAPTAAPASQPVSSATAGDTAQPAPSTAVTSTLFDTWRYKSYAFEIYPSSPSGDTQKALSGFALNVQDQGDSVLVSLKAQSSRYHDAQYTVAKGNTAYFIETTLRDDPNEQENDLGDDGVVVVDPQGYILHS
jgi:uncharacterized membrane protein YphA (DoxX/SURF4 family)